MQNYYVGHYLFAGVASSGNFYRLDPNTGSILRIGQRSKLLLALHSDSAGNLYTGGDPAGDTNYSLEKWDENGDLLWGASCEGDQVCGIDTDPAGNVYAIANEWNYDGPQGQLEVLPKVYKFDSDGSPITVPNFPIDLNSVSGGAGLNQRTPGNAIAVDPVDGRFAVALGSLNVGGLPIGGGAAYLFDKNCNLLTVGGSGTNSQASVCFDFWGRMFSVGFQNQAAGAVYDRLGSFLYGIANFQSQVVGTLELFQCATDGLGRLFVAGQRSSEAFVEGATTVDFTTEVGEITASALTPLFFNSLSYINRAVAAHSSGLYYVAATCADLGTQLIALDARGDVRWVNGALWPASVHTEQIQVRPLNDQTQSPVQVGGPPLICVS
jgi:hypothetical protein